jgi:hypothetical protein
LGTSFNPILYLIDVILQHFLKYYLSDVQKQNEGGWMVATERGGRGWIQGVSPGRFNNQREPREQRGCQMAKKSGPTPGKRIKEVRRLDKRKAKEMKRLEAKERKAKGRRMSGDEDPDIAGIRPGPQPLPEQWDDFGDDE